MSTLLTPILFNIRSRWTDGILPGYAVVTRVSGTPSIYSGSVIIEVTFTWRSESLFTNRTIVVSTEKRVHSPLGTFLVNTLSS